jgi:hypothetical protein
MGIISLFSTTLISANGYRNEKTLVIFHFDFNSVALNENYVRGWLKKAADMGYNAVLWEVEDKIKWGTCPEVVNADAFSKETFKSILNYSRKLGLEPIPLLQTIGHAEYVLQYDKYKPLREDSTRYDCYCTSNPDVRSFIKKWIAEYLKLFGEIKYFHLGGDEAYAFATCSKCKAEADKLGENYLYAEYINDIAQPLLEKGIRPGIWSDMILKVPGEIKIVKKDFIIWDWNYWDGCNEPERVMVWGKGSRLTKDEITEPIRLQFPEIVNQAGKLNPFYTSDALKKLGYDVILCSSSRSHGDGVFAGRNDIHVDNIIGAAQKTVKLNLMGNCVTSWAVRVHNFETQEPWFYLAPCAIINPSLTKEELLIKTAEKIFGVPNNKIFEIINKVGYSFPFANENTTGIMWTGMKDSKPAPENYIMQMIDRWKNPTSNRWNSSVVRIKNSIDTINTGIMGLNEFIPKAKNGKEILNAWSLAGYFQYWQAIVAKEITNNEEGKPESSAEDMVNLIALLKTQYVGWAKSWMTPNSAEQNAGLIYDAIQNYFRKSIIK